MKCCKISEFDTIFQEWQSIFQNIRSGVTPQSLGGGDLVFNNFREAECDKARQIFRAHRAVIIFHYDTFISRYENYDFGEDDGGYVWHKLVTCINRELGEVYEEVLQGQLQASTRLRQDACIWRVYRTILSVFEMQSAQIVIDSAEYFNFLGFCCFVYESAIETVSEVVEKALFLVFGLKYGKVKKSDVSEFLRDSLFSRVMLYDTDKNDVRFSLFVLDE